MYGIALFEEMCVGCRSCTVACQAVRGLAAGAAPLEIKITEEVDPGRGLRLRFSAEACRHCDDAPCVEACTVDAMRRESSGRVVLEEAECINCGSCVEACLYGAVVLDEDRKTAVKCDLCSARIEAGLQAACTAACPGKAIYAGDLEQISPEISGRRARMEKARRR